MPAAVQPIAAALHASPAAPAIAGAEASAAAWRHNGARHGAANARRTR